MQPLPLLLLLQPLVLPLSVPVHAHWPQFMLICCPVCPHSLIPTQLCWLTLVSPIHAHWPPFVLVSVGLLHICPHSFVLAWLCWLTLVGPHSCSPALVCTHRHLFMLVSILLLVPLCLSALSCASWVGPCSCSLPLICAHLHSFAGPCFPLVCSCPAWLHWQALMLIAAHSCPSPLICAHCHLFVGPCLFLPACVHSVVLVSATWLCLCGFCSCLLVFTCVCLCSFGFCSSSFGLRHASLWFDGVLLGFKASSLCQYQIYVGT